MLLKHKPTQSPPGANLTPCSWRKKTRRRCLSIVPFSKGKWHQNLSVGIFSQSWLNTNIAKSKVSRDFMDSTTRYRGFTAGSAEESTCHLRGEAGDSGPTPGWGRSPGGGNGHPLQHSCLETPMDRGAWRGGVQGVAKGRA